MAEPTHAVFLTKGAQNDLETLHAYIAAHRSASEAEQLVDALFDVIDSLERFPMRGPVPQELHILGVDTFRQRLLPPYRLIYEVNDDKVYISVIADGRRDMQALLEQRILGTRDI